MTTTQSQSTQSESVGVSPWFFLGRLIRFSIWLYALNIVLWIGVYTLPLVPGYASKLFFDALEQANPTWNGIPYTVQQLIALLAVFGALNVMTIFGAIRANIPWRFRSSSLLRVNMMRRILTRPGAKAYPGSIGETLNTLRDDAEEAENAGDWTLDIIGQLMYMIIAIGILVSIDAALTVYVFLPLVLVTLISYRLRQRLESLQIKARQTSSHYTALLGEVFQSVQAIQVAGAERTILGQLERRSKARQAAMLRNVALNQALNVFSSNIVALGTGLILLLAGGKMRSGEFTVGEFSLFVLYLWEVGHHTEFFGNFMATVQRAGVAFGRMFGIMQGSSHSELVKAQNLDVRREPPALEPMIVTPNDHLERLDVQALRYVHPASGRGLEEASFDIKRGEFIVVTGRIGSGKTTLLRALLGLLPAQSGEVHWNKQRVSDPAEFMIPPRTAYTPQVPNLISGSVRDNIELGVGEQLERAVKRAVLERDFEHMPQGSETLVGVRGLKLSGGQLQRTAAARMFAQNASLLVFDDISSALDVNTERELWARLEPNTTCLVVSHRKAALERADRIVLLEHGRVTHTGKLGELLQTSSEMRAIWSGERGD
jgi:ATP-binding cassette, subfamily B, bacterial